MNLISKDILRLRDWDIAVKKHIKVIIKIIYYDVKDFITDLPLNLEYKRFVYLKLIYVFWICLINFRWIKINFFMKLYKIRNQNNRIAFLVISEFIKTFRAFNKYIACRALVIYRN